MFKQNPLIYDKTVGETVSRLKNTRESKEEEPINFRFDNEKVNPKREIYKSSSTLSKRKIPAFILEVGVSKDVKIKMKVFKDCEVERECLSFQQKYGCCLKRNI